MIAAGGGSRSSGAISESIAGSSLSRARVRLPDLPGVGLPVPGAARLSSVATTATQCLQL